jgi:hypothetical protein
LIISIEPRYNTTDAVKLLVITALRHGRVASTSVEEMLNAAAARMIGSDLELWRRACFVPTRVIAKSHTVLMEESTTDS